MIGPNCIGLSNLSNQFTTTEINFDNTLKGNVAIIAQSGILGNAMVDWASDAKVGFSKVITLGNKIEGQ